MLLQILDLLTQLEGRINGTPRVSFSRRENVLLLQCEWLVGEKLLRLEHGLFRLDLRSMKAEQTFMLDIFVRKANHEYREKIEEMTQELKDAATTKKRQD